MIRLNQTSTTKRRPKSSNNSISDLLPTTSTATTTNNATTTPEADRLFNELLGENASAIAESTKDDESSAMSSIFSGLLDKYKKSNKSKCSKDDDDGNDILGGIPEHDIDVENNYHEQSQDALQNLLDKPPKADNANANGNAAEEELETNTLLTKPREISFDPTSDDVSALFGAGGVSTTANRDGVESYMGTYAKQRARRPNGLFGMGGGGANSYNSRQQRTRTNGSYASGVDSLLEDITRNSSKSGLTDSIYNDEDNKGHFRRHFRSSARRKQQSNSRSNTTFILLVLVIYVILQIPTVQKHDSKEMNKLKSRHKYDRYDNGGNYDDGTGEGHELRREGMYRREKESLAKELEEEIMMEEDKEDPNLNLHAGMMNEEPSAVDDMAIFSKHETAMAKMWNSKQASKLDNVPQQDVDDKKLSLLRPPPDPPSLTDRHVQQIPKAVDKLSDIEPIQDTSDVPTKYKVFANVKTTYVPGKRETPFFWHIPRSGGVIVKTLMSHCLKMTLAAEVGELEGHDKDEELKVITLFEHNYTNVNVATTEGISRALSLGLVPSHMADVIVSAQVDQITSLFTSNERGRAFVLFRNPVDRAASMFYFLKSMGNERLKNMTLEDYAKSDLIENNWMVRILSDSMTGPIDSTNLETAQRILKEKFIIGILENKRGSFARFDHYFKWKENPNYEKEFGCIKQIMDEKFVSQHPLRKGDDVWSLVFEQNRFDMLLYEYAKELFKAQSAYIFGL